MTNAVQSASPFAANPVQPAGGHVGVQPDAPAALESVNGLVALAPAKELTIADVGSMLVAAQLQMRLNDSQQIINSTDRLRRSTEAGASEIRQRGRDQMFHRFGQAGAGLVGAGIGLKMQARSARIQRDSIRTNVKAHNEAQHKLDANPTSLSRETRAELRNAARGFNASHEQALARAGRLHAQGMAMNGVSAAANVTVQGLGDSNAAGHDAQEKSLDLASKIAGQEVDGHIRARESTDGESRSLREVIQQHDSLMQSTMAVIASNMKI
ncbi:hypothetical protein [Burkholderia ambifaria]|uniref:hypothetical protein n=1 Tax=Burkholderia ambifaria TaxID=152480 RepID=UPI001591B4DE|nr:hypothetical protein [Burkholderia ambifaria]